MNFPDDFIRELKDRNDISDVVSSYASLSRKGRNMVGLCPFHTEKTASFYIYPGNGSFYCFGCGVGGDVITFIRLIENLDYVEAVRFLAKRAGLNVPEGGASDKISRARTLIYEINRESARFYHKVLCSEQGKEALNYLLKRGLKIRTIKRFGLGYAPDGGLALLKSLREKGYKDKDVVASNLAFLSRNGNAVDRFRDRVTFPIIDLRGNVIAFGGRIMKDVKPKYLNTSDTLAFKKSDNLFAMNFAKTKIGKSIILAEGYMDVIALHQAGFENAVATLGTSLTENQARLASRYAEEVIIAYDSDEAGRKASERAIDVLRRNGLLVKVLTIPSGKDPDEFMKSYGDEGPLRFKSLIEKSDNDIEYRLQKAKSGYDLEIAEDKVRYLDQCAKILSQLSSSVERDVYSAKVAEELGVEKGSVMRQAERFRERRLKKEQKKQFREIELKISAANDKINPDKHKNLRASGAEEALLSYIINNQDMVNNIFLRVPSDAFVTDFNKRVYEAVEEICAQGKALDVTSISSRGFSLEETGRIAKIICGYTPSPNIEKAVEEYISVMKQERESREIEKTVGRDEVAVGEYIKSLKGTKK